MNCSKQNQGRNEVRRRPGQEASFAPHVRTWDLSEGNLLHWRKYLWNCWDLSATQQTFGAHCSDSWSPWWFAARGIMPPLQPRRYAPEHNCRALVIEKPGVAKSLLKGAHIFVTMSNTFFQEREKFFMGD